MTANGRMKFGVFMAPFHRVNENPTLALDRDLELLQWLDTLGFDEAYIGEHHSAGWETIASPEVFIATAAERTRHIRLGTGVISLPYHHPYMVANRMVLLDHLTKGRVILGVGPGAFDEVSAVGVGLVVVGRKGGGERGAAAHAVVVDQQQVAALELQEVDGGVGVGKRCVLALGPGLAAVV